jgi:hypothetical protein
MSIDGASGVVLAIPCHCSGTAEGYAKSVS